MEVAIKLCVTQLFHSCHLVIPVGIWAYVWPFGQAQAKGSAVALFGDTGNRAYLFHYYLTLTLAPTLILILTLTLTRIRPMYIDWVNLSFASTSADANRG